MSFRISALLVVGCFAVAISGASIADNSIYETPRIENGEKLISSIVNECLSGDTMSCLKGKVLTYLDTVLGLREEQGRSFSEQNVDKVIFDRVGRVLATNELRFQLPETFFGKTVVSYNSVNGLDFALPQEEARGDLLKKKLLLPVLLLLKLKLKALMPIFVGLIGLKAMKALILSKLAITLVIGFIVAQLVKKSGLGMPMSMMPMMPAEPPMTAYGAPAPTSEPSSSYSPSWEPSNGSGPYARVWDPSSSSSSAHNLAYSSYYPSSSSSGSSSSGSASPSSSSSSSSSSYSS